MDILNQAKYELLNLLFEDLSPDEIRELTQKALEIRRRQTCGVELSLPAPEVPQGQKH